MASDLEFFFLAVLEGGTRISGCRARPGSGASAPLALTPSCWVPVWSQAGSASSSPAAPNSNDLSKPPPPTATTLGLGCPRIDPGGVNLSPQRADSEPDPAAGGGRDAFISFRLEPSAGSSKRSNIRDASKPSQRFRHRPRRVPPRRQCSRDAAGGRDAALRRWRLPAGAPLCSPTRHLVPGGEAAFCDDALRAMPWLARARQART